MIFDKKIDSKKRKEKKRRYSKKKKKKLRKLYEMRSTWNHVERNVQSSWNTNGKHWRDVFAFSFFNQRKKIRLDSQPSPPPHQRDALSITKNFVIQADAFRGCHLQLPISTISDIQRLVTSMFVQSIRQIGSDRPL